MVIDELATRNQLAFSALALRIQAGESASWQELLAIRNAAENKTLTILLDDDGLEVGYIAWANINKETALKLLQSGAFPHYPYEWSEGNICLIDDIMFIPNKSKNAQKSLSLFLSKKRVIIFYRKHKTTLYIQKLQFNNIRKYKKHYKKFSDILTKK